MNKDFTFFWRFKNFAIRTVHQDWHDRNSPLLKNHPIELVKFFDDTYTKCYVVALFELNDEGYELHFIGDRPFKDIDANEIKEIWIQLQASQKMLDAYF